MLLSFYDVICLCDYLLLFFLLLGLLPLIIHISVWSLIGWTTRTTPILFCRWRKTFRLVQPMISAMVRLPIYPQLWRCRVCVPPNKYMQQPEIKIFACSALRGWGIILLEHFWGSGFVGCGEAVWNPSHQNRFSTFCFSQLVKFVPVVWEW